MYKVYLAKLKREDAFPKCVYKVGITGSSDAMTRLTYAKADEPNPIINTFPDIKVMNSIVVATKEKAVEIEANIMEAIRHSKGDKWFHNWFEPTQVSSITEMRKWDFEEIQSIFKIMEQYKPEPW